MDDPSPKPHPNPNPKKNTKTHKQSHSKRPIHIPLAMSMPYPAPVSISVSTSVPAAVPVPPSVPAGGNFKSKTTDEKQTKAATSSHNQVMQSTSHSQTAHSQPSNPKPSNPPSPALMAMLQAEMGEVRQALRAQPHASDIRLLIFAAAASDKKHQRTLVPVPPVFQAAAGAGCDVERLRRAVADNWPGCRLMLDILSADEQYAALDGTDADAIHLLHWLLVASPALPTLRRLSGLHLRRLCRVLGLARPTHLPGQLLSISYKEKPAPNPDRPKPSYGYLGLPFGHLYRFLATGRLDKPAGEPVRLYVQPESALVHCYDPMPPQFQAPTPAYDPSLVQLEGGQEEGEQETNDEEEEVEKEEEEEGEDEDEDEESEEEDKEDNGKAAPYCWPHSILTEPQQALVICELPAELDDSIAKSPEKHFLEFFVQQASTLRPRYLLLFAEPVAATMMLSWPGRRVEGDRFGPSLVKRSQKRIARLARNLGGSIRRIVSAV